MVFVIPVTKEEDERLLTYINAHGEGSWRFLPKSTGLNRCGKSCRLRWINYLCPDLKRGNFTLQEDQLIRNLHAVLRNKWSMIVFMFQSPNLLRLMEEIKPVFETDEIEAPIRYLNDLSEVTVLPSMPS